jgi:hypothetical protein
LIFGGTRVCHTSLKWVTDAPCSRPQYTDHAENSPEVSRDHEILSLSSSTGRPWISRHRLAHSTFSANPN